MSPVNKRLPFVFLYLDNEGIESLYAQTTDRVEIELSQSRSNQTSGAVGLTVGIGNLLTTLIGLKGASAETELKAINGHIEQARSRLSIEHKLEKLSQFFVQSNQCFEDLYAAAESATEPGCPIFIRIEDKFDSPDFAKSEVDFKAIISSKAFVFTKGENYDPSDAYFKRSRFRFIMSASLDKFPRLNGFVSKTSHEAIAFRGMNGRDIPLGVFGYLVRHSELVFQIKPYAIWI